MAWLASVVATALVAVMLLSVGGTTAKTPGWGFSAITANPDPVGPGNLADYSFTLSNTGKSNISAVYLTTDIPTSSALATPAWILETTWHNNPGGPANPCGANPPSGPLNCVLGAMPAGSSIDFQIVFTVSSSTGPYTFHLLATGNGNTPSDSGGTSHGDTLKGTATVSVSGSSEYDGGFTLGDGGTFGTTGTVSKNNPQTSSVVTQQSFVATTIQESATYTLGTDPCQASGATCIGQWTKLTAPNAAGHPIRLTMMVYGKGLPGNITAADIDVIHLDNGGSDDGILGDEASERCASATDSASAPCIYVAPVGQNFLITIWLLHNGSIRGQTF